MTTNTTETLAARVDRYNEAFAQIPTLETDGWNDEQWQQHEDQVVRLEEDPEQIVFVEGYSLAAVAGALATWLKLPESDATRDRLVQMVDEAITGCEE